jgi:hypothetical protein
MRCYGDACRIETLGHVQTVKTFSGYNLAVLIDIATGS